MFNENEFLRKVGEGLRLERKRNGLSQSELAELSALHKNFIGHIERGEKSPTLVSLLRICSALGINLGDFFQQQNL